MPVNLAQIESTNHDQVLEQYRKRLLDHPLYDAVNSAKRLRLFMQEHIFAVWDFMSLLKRLQQIVTCCDVPWLPVKDALAARFVNEIVLGEECDEDGFGGYTSHFELYLSAMEEIGAETGPVHQFVSTLRATAESAQQCSTDTGSFRKLVSTIREGSAVDQALDQLAILPSTLAFVRSTIDLTVHGKPHEVAAAFFYGREDIIPEMFVRFVDSLPKEGRSQSNRHSFFPRPAGSPAVSLALCRHAS